MTHILRINEINQSNVSSDGLSFFEPIKPINDLNELKLEVKYNIGGWNVGTGDIDKNGIYVYVNPVKRDQYGIGSRFSQNKKETGFKILVKPIGRKSKKSMLAIAEKLKPVTKKIAELYNEEKYKEIAEILIELGK